MTAYNVINPTTLVAGQPEDVSVVLANFNAIAAVVNNLDQSNISPSAAIPYSKLSLTGGIVNSDIAAGAAIAASKLALPPTGFTLICDSQLGASQASFDTNTILAGNIPNTYKHLRLVARGRADPAATTALIYMRFNNDSGANYHDQIYENSSATTLIAAEDGPNGNQFRAGRFGAASATAGHAGQLVLDILDYNDSTFVKFWSGTSICSVGAGAGAKTLNLLGGEWHTLAALTRITLFPSSGNFIAGSRFSLYGYA